MVSSGEFREDLYFRLNVLSLNIPPLRERKEDIPNLVNHMLRQLSTQNPSVVRTISRDALQMLKAYAFPGNVRELENVVESAFYMCAREEIQVQDFPPEIAHKAARSIEAGRSPSFEHAASKTDGELSASKIIPPEQSPAEMSRRAAELYRMMSEEGLSFWKVVKEPFMRREIPRTVVQEIIKLGLERSQGRYRNLLPDFHLDSSEYTVFMNFLRKHACQVDYKPYRQQASTPQAVHHS
jgi:DNA-binding NtrC family response regulator